MENALEQLQASERTVQALHCKVRTLERQLYGWRASVSVLAVVSLLLLPLLTVKAQRGQPAIPHLAIAPPQAEAVKVDTRGVTARILREDVIQGPLTELNGRYKLRVTEINVAPGGYVGDHHHLGPGIRLATVGRMEYILPDKRIIYGPGDLYFEAGDVTHRVVNNSNSTAQRLIFEILPRDVVGPSLILPRKKGTS